jgi:hypothetical protein
VTDPGRDGDRVQFGTARPGTALGGLQWRQLAMLVAAALWALAVTRLVPGATGAVVGLSGAALCTVAALARPGGRLPVDWTAIAGRFASRRLTGRTRHRRLNMRGSALPAHLGGVRVLEVATDRGPIGVVRDGARLIAALTLEAEPMMLAGDAESAGRRAAWGGILAGLARPGTAVSRVQWIARTRGLGPRAQSAFVPKDAPDATPSTAVASYLDVVARIGSASRDYVVTLALAVDGRRGPLTDALQQVLDAGSDLIDQIHAAGLGSARLLDPGGLTAALRGTVDAGLGDALAASPHGGIALPPDPEDVGPMAVDESWGDVRCDGTWNAVFWISQWPRGEVPGDVLAPLVLAGPVTGSVAVVMEPRDPARAVREAEQARLRDAADDDLRERAGFLRTVRRSRQQSAVSAQERELADGHAAYRFAGYVAVTSGSREALDDACRELEVAATQARCEVRRLWGDQASGLSAVIPLCRGLG